MIVGDDQYAPDWCIFSSVQVHLREFDEAAGGAYFQFWKKSHAYWLAPPPQASLLASHEFDSVYKVYTTLCPVVTPSSLFLVSVSPSPEPSSSYTHGDLGLVSRMFEGL